MAGGRLTALTNTREIMSGTMKRFFHVTTCGVNGYQPEVGQSFVSLSDEDF